MNSNLPRYNDYPVIASPEEVTDLKDKISSAVARSASVLITIADTDASGSVTRQVTFEVSDANANNDFISFGRILPQGTEASVKSKKTASGTEYLELLADLSDKQTPSIS